MHSIASSNGGIVTAAAEMRPVESADLLDARENRSSDASHAVNTVHARHVGTLFFQEEETRVTAFGKQGRSRRPSIDPAVKSWIDNVIVPALQQQWANKQGSGAAV